MATVSRGLPAQPHLDIPKREARALLKDCRAALPEALARIRGRHPRFTSADDATIAAAKLQLADAQLVLAREYGFSSWPELKRRISANTVAQTLRAAIHANDRALVRQLLLAHPDLLHLPLWSGNWGPPMSHAANLGQLEIIAECHALGARDHQHAFDRAILQGQLECARWLHAHGAKLEPGLVMGPCETLNPDGLRFLIELGAPLTNAAGDRLAPLALILETYGRHPERKHACLDLLAAHGYDLPDTPIMSLHRGRIDRLERHLSRDPHLLAHRFSYREIYPPELGCPDDGRTGMHGTPIGGTTLLHLAIDFEERELFDWLLAHGADVNAPAAIDAEGFGGHTPLFHAVVSHTFYDSRGQDASVAQALLERGANPNVHASLRKFLDWIDEPRWHIARDVTPVEWAASFPHRNWINSAALDLIAAAANRA